MHNNNLLRIDLNPNDADIVLESLTYKSTLIKKIIVQISSDIKKDVELGVLSEILNNVTRLKDKIQTQKENQFGLNTLQ